MSIRCANIAQLAIPWIIAGCVDARILDIPWWYQADFPRESNIAEPELGQLSLDGAVNDLGARLIEFIDASGESFALDIKDGILEARNPNTGQRALTGEQLIDGRIVVARDASALSGREHWIFIRRILPWDRLSNEVGTETAYHLTYASASDPENETYLCTGQPEAVLVAGEKYHPITLQRQPIDDPEPWFHIACAGDVLWTMKLLGYDPARPPIDPYYTTAVQRQATIQMLRADYCGNGLRFAHAEPPIYMQNRAGWTVFDIAASPGWPVYLEAGWNGRGAACLDLPRVRDVHSRRDIEETCGRNIPPCNDEFLATSEWITWTP